MEEERHTASDVCSDPWMKPYLEPSTSSFYEPVDSPVLRVLERARII